MTGYSLHLGLNKIDHAAYNGWDGALRGCHLDAYGMEGLARRAGFTSNTVLLDAEANGARLAELLASHAANLVSGDTLFWTYSGHGSQVRDLDGDEADRKDETWLLFGSQWLDDQTRGCLERFQAGVRVILLSDSCHSGSVARDTPAERAGKRYAEAQPRGAGGASVLLISGCRDVETSGDTARGGVFTQALLDVWQDGAFQGNWKQLHADIVSRINDPGQQPVLSRSGPPIKGWLRERPFQP